MWQEPTEVEKDAIASASNESEQIFSAAMGDFQAYTFGRLK
jgi:hypothetical protein